MTPEEFRDRILGPLPGTSAITHTASEGRYRPHFTIEDDDPLLLGELHVVTTPLLPDGWTRGGPRPRRFTAKRIAEIFRVPLRVLAPTPWKRNARRYVR